MDIPESDSSPETSPARDAVPPPEGASWQQLQKQVHTLEARFQVQVKRQETDREGLLEQCDYLRKLIVGLSIACLFLLGGVCLFFGKQMRVVRTQLMDQGPVIRRNLNEFHHRMEPQLQQFLGQLQAYAAAHAEFQPILDRYRARLPEYFATMTPAMPLPAPVTTGPPNP